MSEPVLVRCAEPECSQQVKLRMESLGSAAICPECERPFAALSEDQWATLAQRAVSEPREIPENARRIVVLDHLRSQWNVGAVFRTSDGAGWDHIALCGITPTPPAAGVAKTALGAERWVSWSYHPSGAALIETLRNRGIQCVALEQTEHARPCGEIELAERAALVIGNEVHGVSPEVLRRCALHAAIPMRGRKDSLNVAVAFGIAAYGGVR